LARGSRRGPNDRGRPAESGDPDDPEFIELCGEWLDHPVSYSDNIRLYPDKFASVFREIAGAEAAVLVHCAAGRDRTGMVMAMLLHLSGVTPEAIADDYVAAAIRFNAGLGVEPGLTAETAHSAAVMEDRIASRRPALLGWLASLDVEAYLGDAGLSEAEIDAVRTRLLR
jgi:protein-tyrosine phosphatase